MALTATELLDGVRDTYQAVGRDLEHDVRGLGQVGAAQSRAEGHVFGKHEHVRGLVRAQLSNQRPWGPIADNLDASESIFHGFELGYLRTADPASLTSGLLSLRCGNRQVRHQMAALKANIAVFDRIEVDYGDVDAFVTSDSPERIAWSVAEGNTYKLRQIGLTLALEYLKNVGLDAGKPDDHVRCILGPGRLAYFKHDPLEMEAALEVKRPAAEAGTSATYMDNVLWLFCARDYGGVCGAAPRGHLCELRSACASG